VVAPQFILWVKKTGPAEFLNGAQIVTLLLDDNILGSEKSEDGADLIADGIYDEQREDTGDEFEEEGPAGQPEEGVSEGETRSYQPSCIGICDPA